MATTYYPFFITNPPGMGSETVKSALGYISIETDSPPIAGWPQLTVNGKVGINYNPQSAYDAAAPDLAVQGKVGIGYDFDSSGSAYNYPEAPALSVLGKVVLGPDLRGSSYSVATAPTLGVTGDALIDGKTRVTDDTTIDKQIDVAGNATVGGQIDVAGSATVGGHIRVVGEAMVDSDIKVKGNATVDSNITVQGNATIGGRVYFLQNKSFANQDVTDIKDTSEIEGDIAHIKNNLGNVEGSIATINKDIAAIKSQPGQAGVFIDTTDPEQTYDLDGSKRPDVTYPVFAVVNGLMGHVQTKDPLTPDLTENLEEIIKTAIQTKTGFDGHYILMGDLRGLLRNGVKPAVIDPNDPSDDEVDQYRDAYGMRMSWDTDFVMLKLVDINEHNVTKKKKVKGKPKSVTTSFPTRKDAVLAWGDKRENYFRIRYIGEEVDILKMDARKSPLGKSLTDQQETREKKRRQKAYDSARRRILRALADSGGQKIDRRGWKDAWPGYRDIIVVDPDGSVVVNGAIHAIRIAKPSDARLKEAVEPIRSAKDLALAMRGVTFAWKSSDDNKVRPDKGLLEYGMIAQEVEKLCPAAVSRDNDGLLAIEYDQIVPILLEAIKDQEKVISSQHSRLDRLEKLVEDLGELPSKGRKRVSAAARGKSPAPERSPAARSAPSRTGRAARGPRQ